MKTGQTKQLKVIKTCCMYLSFFTLGASLTVTGTCLLDLQHLVNTETQRFVNIFTARPIGYIAGAVFGAIFLDFFKSNQAVLTACNLMVTITMFGIPWCTNFLLLFVFIIISGFSQGAIITGGNVICLQLWRKDSGPFFQALHFSFALGKLVSPLIAVPFLDYPSLRDIPSTNFNETDLVDDSSNLSLNVTNNMNTLLHIPRIVYPFSMIGTFALIVTILNLTISIISPTEDEIREDAKDENSGKSIMSIFVTVFFSFLLLMVISATEMGYGQTLTLYALNRELPGATKDVSKVGYMTFAFWASLTIGRLAAVGLAIKINSLIILIGNISIVSVSAVILSFYIPNEWLLWVASVLSGIGMSSSYAALIGYIGCHICISNKISGILTVGSAVGEKFGSIIYSYFKENISEMFPFITATACVLMIFLTFVLYCTFKRHSINTGDNTRKCYVNNDISKDVQGNESKL